MNNELLAKKLEHFMGWKYHTKEADDFLLQMLTGYIDMNSKLLGQLKDFEALRGKECSTSISMKIKYAQIIRNNLSHIEKLAELYNASAENAYGKEESNPMPYGDY